MLGCMRALQKDQWQSNRAHPAYEEYGRYDNIVFSSSISLSQHFNPKPYCNENETKWTNTGEHRRLIAAKKEPLLYLSCMKQIFSIQITYHTYVNQRVHAEGIHKISRRCMLKVSIRDARLLVL
ncbi:hypothetical protein ABG067_005693 [Albugo candida]